jgi:hypothetical protein
MSPPQHAAHLAAEPRQLQLRSCNVEVSQLDPEAGKVACRTTRQQHETVSSLLAGSTGMLLSQLHTGYLYVPHVTHPRRAMYDR